MGLSTVGAFDAPMPPKTQPTEFGSARPGQRKERVSEHPTCMGRTSPGQGARLLSLTTDRLAVRFSLLRSGRETPRKNPTFDEGRP